MIESKPTEEESREKLRLVGQEILENCKNKNYTYEQVLMKAERTLLLLRLHKLKTGFQRLDSALQMSVDTIGKLRPGKEIIPGMKTGLTDLDELLEGLHPGNLYVIGGRPGMGKTALILTILRNVSLDEKMAVGIFAFEMSSLQVATRLLCMEAKLDVHLVRTGKLSKSQWKDLVDTSRGLEKASVFIDDTYVLSLLRMKHNAIRLKAEHDIKLLLIDDLQLVLGIENSDDRRIETQSVYRLLKTMAIELDIPVIVTSQLSRRPEERENKRPILNDFLYASEVEESADTILLLYRPWLYTHEESEKEKAEIIIPKNHSGSTGVVNLRFIDKYPVFEKII